MFAKAYEDKGLPENLSRTLETLGTVTSVLIPWNTCGAYQSGTLGFQQLIIYHTPFLIL
jgi:NhaC family Na+:H+ antiporter